jgi:hypothetical protein
MEMEKKRGPFYFFRQAGSIVGEGREERSGLRYAVHLLIFRHSHGGIGFSSTHSPKLRD